MERASRRGSRAILILLMTGLFGGASLSALYARVETRRVPVVRLVENLENQLAADPANPRLHTNLARLHGMAWALKATEVPAAPDRSSDRLEPWYGYPGHHHIPYRDDVKQGSAEQVAASRSHLTAALQHYEAALKLDPDSLLANLGYAWMLQQSGDIARAIEGYRQVIALAGPTERTKRLWGPGGRSFTYEAAGYLIPLLDPAEDAPEVKELESMRAHFEALPRAVTPIAIPLSASVSASQIHDRTARVRFDADGAGLRREWTWLTPEAGWLVHDAGGRGEITSALQLFGNVSFWLFWENGYLALAGLDNDRNGELAGAELVDLAIWHDANANGISEPGEVRPLASHGIVAVSCEYEAGDGVEFAAVSPAGVRLHTGETRPTYDVILRSAAWNRTLD